MPKEAYFVKINKGITWEQVLQLTQEQIKNSRKRLQYISVATLTLPQMDFQNIISYISCPHPAFISLCNQSITDNSGIWNCITLHSVMENYDVVIFTAGRTFPLYVAVIENRM